MTAAETCSERERGALDLHLETNAVAVEAHVRMTIDRIIELTPRLAERLVLRGS